MTMRAAIVLAAGQGARLGGRPKALLEAPGGGTFLSRIVDTARVHVARVLVVTGEDAAAAPVRAEAERLGVELVGNPRAKDGMSSSLRCGLLAAAGVEGALVWPCDVAMVQASTLAWILSPARADRIVLPVLADDGGRRGGHPVWFGAGFFSDLMDPGLELAGGARSVLRAAPPQRVIRVIVQDPWVRYDVDTPEDYAKLMQQPSAQGD